MRRGELSAVIARLMSKYLQKRGVKEMPFPCSPLIRECSRKKTQKEKKKEKKGHIRWDGVDCKNN